jgi:hypothetical protein
MKKTILLASLVVCLFTANSVFAGRMWYYNEITDSQGTSIGSGDTAIGMRSGSAWPVVAYSDNTVANSGVASMLPGAWAEGPVSLVGQYLDGATAVDSTVAFVSNEGQVVTFGKTGWSSNYCGSGVMPSYKNSIAFNNNSAPGVLYRSNDNLMLSMKSGGAWYSSAVKESATLFTPDAYALAFDSYNQANVAFENGGELRYATKGVSTGNDWVFNLLADAPTIGETTRLDMALTADDDVPFVLYSNEALLKYSIYDRHSDSWMTSVLDDALVNPKNFCVTADSSGGIGVAYVAKFAGQNMLSYAYNDGSGWTWLDRLTLADATKMIGLTFDYENNPVISYCYNNKMCIAYDPVAVPEPATMAILALGFALIRRR